MPIPPRFPGRGPFIGVPIAVPRVPVPPAAPAPAPPRRAPAGAAPGAGTRPAAPSRAPVAPEPPPAPAPAFFPSANAWMVPSDPEPPIPREVPPNLVDSKAVADWILTAIHAHGRLRAKSFYDTGHFIDRLLELRELFGVANIKELASKVPLGMSHMTANKYLQIARTFSRELALEHGIEKCYALLRYAKAIGRPDEAGAILAANEPIRGSRGLYAADASAAKIGAAVSALKQAERDSKVPTEVRAGYERTAHETEKAFRRLGMRGADAHVVRRDGTTQIAVYIPIDVATSWESTLPRAVARFGLRLAKTKPEAFEPLREAGWRVPARARAPA